MILKKINLYIILFNYLLIHGNAISACRSHFTFSTVILLNTAHIIRITALFIAFTISDKFRLSFKFLIITLLYSYFTGMPLQIKEILHFTCLFEKEESKCYLHSYQETLYQK